MPPDATLLARRCERIAPFHVMALVERAQQLEAAGRDVIHLGVGEPDFPTPAPILAAGQAALAAGQTRYTPALGLPALRAAVAQEYRTRFGVPLPASRIAVTPGASGALQLVLSALVNPGDGVLVTDPGYPCNRHFVELLSGDPQPMRLTAESGWRPTPQALRDHWRPNTRVALLASPDNPTGQVLMPQEVRALADTVRELGGVLVMDEIYQGLVYGVPAHSALAVAEDVWVINSFSKFYGMTGWRLGWAVVPEAWMPALERMAQNFFLAPCTLSQHAALAAFGGEAVAELERRRQELAQRRTLLMDALPPLGFKVVGRPEGAFYLYLDASALTRDTGTWAAGLLEQEAVALTPGLDFGTGHGPQQYLRLAYTTSLARLEEALERIRRYGRG